MAIKEIDEVQKIVEGIKNRDNKRDIHVHDPLIVVSTRDDGFDLMHLKNVLKQKGKIYQVTLTKIY